MKYLTLTILTILMLLFWGCSERRELVGGTTTIIYNNELISITDDLKGEEFLTTDGMNRISASAWKSVTKDGPTVCILVQKWFDEPKISLDRHGNRLESTHAQFATIRFDATINVDADFDCSGIVGHIKHTVK